LGKNADIYPFGEASLNNQPLNSDLGFRTKYSYDFNEFQGDIISSIPYLWLVLPFIIVLVVPGSLVLEWSGLSKDQEWCTNLALSIGLSLSLISIFLTWTTLLGLRLNQNVSIILASILSILWLIRKSKYFASLDFITIKNNVVKCIPIGIIFLITLATRFIMIRDLVTPPWVDSIHHGLITRLIIENGAYPSNYHPYSFAQGYHSGFHSVLAFFHWLSDLSLPQSMLWLGQVLNASFVFTAFLFSKLFFKSQKAAIFTGIAAGLLSPMPAYYTSWGRYPHLAGLIIFPAVVAVSLHFLNPVTNQSNQRVFNKKKQLILASILFGGLIITHYRISAFFFFLLLTWICLITFKIRPYPKIKPVVFQLLIRLVLLALVTLLLVAPWLIPALDELIVPRLGAKSINPNFPGFPIEYLTSAYGKILIVLAVMGWLLGLLQRKKSTILLSIWIGLLFFSANLSYFKIPGGAYINPSSVGITLFLPISVFAGYFISYVVNIFFNLVHNKARIYLQVLWLMLTLSIGFFGAIKITSLLNPVTFLSRQADLNAMTWIENHIPTDETIFINPFMWGYNLYAGNDGGYWITPLTGRKTLPEPVLYGFTNDRQIVKNINQLLAELIQLSNQPDELAKLLRENSIGYLYLGARGGIYSPAIINQSAEFQLCYYRDGVWIYKIK